MQPHAKKQESSPAENRKKRTARRITCPRQGVPHPVPDVGGGVCHLLPRGLPWVPHTDLGPELAEVPPEKGPETSGSIMGWTWVIPQK